MSAAQLAQALSILPKPEDKNLLVGVNTVDDAGVYRISDSQAVVYTIDILTPVISDPVTYGKVSAANCISDIYAMGGEPKLALNIIGFPNNGDPEVLGEILLGGQAKAVEAGVLIIGGHTFATDEIKYGLAVIGYVHPDKAVTNAGAQPGDVIVLTKPIGVGTMIQTLLVNKDSGIDLEPVINNMVTLNKQAAVAMQQTGVHACTDVTGYGLAGHLVELAQASQVSLEINTSKIPVHKGALDLVKQGLEEPGIAMNFTSFNKHVQTKNIDPAFAKLIFSSETSGGLIIVLPRDKLATFQKQFSGLSPVIGRVLKGDPGQVSFVE
jgi:selenide,water dikinase